MHPEETATVSQQGDSPLPEILRENLPRSLFTKAVYYFPVLGSTNSYLTELAKGGEPEGALAITEKQTRGKGRLGRQWHSPSGVNLLFSTLFRPPLSIDRVFSLTMLTTVSLVDAVREMTGLRALIKWPNDIYCNNKKMAGILTEFSADTRGIEYVVVGTGLNVNWDMRDRPELEHVATSLMKEVGHPISRIALLSHILEKLERNYKRLLRGEDGPIRDRWNTHSMVIGKEVLIDPEGKAKRAKATGIDRNGSLLIEEEGGRPSSVVCGDVRVLFPSLPGGQR
jgi:BirA family biotin operon repressor/biotin-[acetyl-CoA-carboxylase] ligase